jgi:hypothetical protein
MSRLLAILPALLCLSLLGCSSGRGVQLNPGAVVPVYHAADRFILGEMLNREPLHGAFVHDPEAIYLDRAWDPVAGTVLHEFMHLLMKRLRDHPEARAVAFRAFRDLCTPDFELGRADLMEYRP